MLKKLYHIYFLLKRPMTLGVRAIICDERRRVLLVRHTYVNGWYFPGGGVESGQSMLQALKTELHEEVKINEIGKAKLFGIYLNRHVSKRDHVALYVCEKWRDMGKFTQNREIAEIGFFALDDLPVGISPGTRNRLKEVYEGAEISQDWQ